MTGRCGRLREISHGLRSHLPDSDEISALAPDQIADAWWKKRLAFGTGEPAIQQAPPGDGNRTEDFRCGRAQQRGRQGSRRFSGFSAGSIPARDKRAAAKAFGLPADRFLVLLAGSVLDPRKGGPATSTRWAPWICPCW